MLITEIVGGMIVVVAAVVATAIVSGALLLPLSLPLPLFVAFAACEMSIMQSYC